MRNHAPASTSDVQAAAPNENEPAGRSPQAAQGPIVEPVSAAGIAAPVTPPSATPAPPTPASPTPADLGRRILSTAFVRVGPGGHLTIAHRDGTTHVLRDVVIGPKDYCGTRLDGHAPGARYCGAYADVTAARPGDAPVGAAPIDAANPR
ncbi:hypothetical protein M9980_12390 [Sphingomonas donggukensis]|uniref:Uncharacterized protein n=1 Tax=Sphingomonas donggukensis TaxID=2949093 RepID=A0ABY4TSD4_9SPHN|nr:hypothetical protein [Sphingomonas donggukensis]URW75323.1 hypothetical protein M9980_12390 [Sphingomonas donggukensis]